MKISVVYMSWRVKISEEYCRIAAVNLRCVTPIRRKATETEGLVIILNQLVKSYSIVSTCDNYIDLTYEF